MRGPMTVLIHQPSERHFVALRHTAALLAAALAAALGLLAADASAQTAIWDGGGVSGNWSDAENWTVPANVPVNSGTSTLTFSGSTGTTNNNDLTNLTLGGTTALTLNSSGFNLGGNAVTLNGNISSTITSGTNTISLAGLTVAATRTISTGGGSTLAISSDISGLGGITLAAGTNATYTLSGTNSFSGGLTVSGGTSVLNASSASAFGANTATHKLTFGRATINYTGGSQILANNIDNTAAGNVITLNLNSSSLEFTGTTTIPGAAGFGVNGGTLTLRTLAGPGTAAGGQLVGTGTLIIKESSSYSGGFRLNTATGRILIGHGQALGTGTIAAIAATGMSIGSTQDVTVSTTTFNTGTASGHLLTLGGDHRFTVETAIVGLGQLQKFGAGALVLTAANTYSAATQVNAGTLLVDGSILSSPSVTVASGARLGGSGSVTAISGAGRVSPGNSPGILTATSVALGSGLDFAFEFNQAGAPTWGTSTASGNDVLRLTDLTTPISGTAGTGNVFDIYFAATGQTYLGGLFTDRTSSFESLISGATFNYFVRNEATGSVTFNGLKYDPLDSADVTRSTVQVSSAAFAGGTVSGGYAMEFVVVPEPATLAVVAAGLASAWVLRPWRRRLTQRLDHPTEA
jgi:fibronectin-binding autotransporter adhesin